MSMNMRPSNHGSSALGIPLHGHRAANQIAPKSLLRLNLHAANSENFGLGDRSSMKRSNDRAFFNNFYISIVTADQRERAKVLVEKHAFSHPDLREVAYVCYEQGFRRALAEGKEGASGEDLTLGTETGLRLRVGSRQSALKPFAKA
jgi:hypothetical protein